jgi:Recombination endonuclease VII
MLTADKKQRRYAKHVARTLDKGLCKNECGRKHRPNRRTCELCAEKEAQRGKRKYAINRDKILARQTAYYQKNAEQIKKYSKKWWLSKPKEERRLYARRKGVWTKYRLTTEQHYELLKKQNFTCPITGLSVDLSSSIDHDHNCCPGQRSCGKCVRGIIHGRINTALGAFLKPDWLLAAYNYVTK